MGVYVGNDIYQWHRTEKLPTTNQQKEGLNNYI